MISVRLATLDDAEEIARQTSGLQQLHEKALPFIFKPPSPDLFPRQKLAALIQDPNSIVAVAELDGKIVGHIYGMILNRTENEFNHPHRFLYIYQIGVDEGARCKGVGTALIHFMRDRTRTFDLGAMQVDHWAFNARAAAFFEACGFSPMKMVLRQPLKAGGSK